MLFVNDSNIFQGLSTDTKPIPPIVSVGDKFFETDTLKLYEYINSEWKRR